MRTLPRSCKCANTQNKRSKAAARCTTEMAGEKIKSSNHIDGGMTEGQRYAGLEKNEPSSPQLAQTHISAPELRFTDYFFEDVHAELFTARSHL